MKPGNRSAISGTTAIATILLAGLSFTAVGAQEPVQPASPGTIVCNSQAGSREHCAADTSAGIALVRATGPAECLLGKTWGYDEKGVWVTDGCGGEFVLGQVAGAIASGPPPAPAGPNKPAERIEEWGEFAPGGGFLVGRGSAGELSISGYALLRYVNQMPGEQTFTDHLGNERTVDGRNDFYPHRVMVFFKGWLGSPKLIYTITFWTVATTDQRAIFGNIGYQFNRKFSLYGGLNGNPGTRSLQGSHPYWLGHDRVMADEFFRPFFGSGIWAQGELTPGLWYNVVTTNNNSSLGVKTSQLDRDVLDAAPRCGGCRRPRSSGPAARYGDWEMHDKVATRFGVSSTCSPEQRFTDARSNTPENTTIRLADSVNVFDTGALGARASRSRPVRLPYPLDRRRLEIPGHLPADRDLQPLARRLQGRRRAAGDEIHDTGFYVQAAFYPVQEDARALHRDVPDLRR